MSMLERLNEQASGFQNFQNEAENRINNFDLETQMYSGAEAAYRLGHENMNIALGAETMRALHTGLPTAYKIGKATAQRAAAATAPQPFTPAGPKDSPKVPTPKNPAGSGAPEAPTMDPATTIRGQTETFTQGAARNLNTNALPEGAAEEATAASRAALAESSKVSGASSLSGAEEALAKSKGLLRGNESSTLPRPRADIPDPAFKNTLPELPESKFTPSGNLDYPKAPALKNNLPKPRGPRAPDESPSFAPSKPPDEAPSFAPPEPPTLPPPPAEGMGSTPGLQYQALRTQEDPSMPNLHGDNPLNFTDDQQAQMRALADNADRITGTALDDGPVAAPRSAASLASRAGEPAAPDIPIRPTPAPRSAQSLATKLAENESKVAPEEAVADAFPGIGEIIGGIIDIGIAASTIAESASAKSDPAPKQPAGQAAMSVAFDSSPVINSADYHNL